MRNPLATSPSSEGVGAEGNADAVLVLVIVSAAAACGVGVERHEPSDAGARRRAAAAGHAGAAVVAALSDRSLESALDVFVAVWCDARLSADHTETLRGTLNYLLTGSPWTRTTSTAPALRQWRRDREWWWWWCDEPAAVAGAGGR